MANNPNADTVSMANCVHKSSTPTPFKRIPRKISRNHVSGSKAPIHCAGSGIAARGKM